MKRVKKPWKTWPQRPQTKPLSLPVSCTESLLGGGTLPSPQHLSSTYSAALPRADINQAPSKPSPRQDTSLPQTQITTPLLSQRLPKNFPILAPLRSSNLRHMAITKHIQLGVLPRSLAPKITSVWLPISLHQSTSPLLQPPLSSDNPAPEVPRASTVPAGRGFAPTPVHSPFIR